MLSVTQKKIKQYIYTPFFSKYYLYIIENTPYICACAIHLLYFYIHLYIYIFISIIVSKYKYKYK